MSGFNDVFENPNAGQQPVGGGVTPGKEPWLSQGGGSTVKRTPKPLILYGAMDDTQAPLFLATMSGILARNQGEACFVRDDGSGVVVDPGTGKWVPIFDAIPGLDRVSLALEDSGVDPTRVAIQPYRNVVGGIGGLLHYVGGPVLAVRTVQKINGEDRLYENRHDLGLVLNAGGYSFATEVRIGVGLPPQHKPGQA